MVDRGDGTRLRRAVLTWEDGYSATYEGAALRRWENSMVEGQRLRLAMRALTSTVSPDAEITDDKPMSLFDVILKDGDGT